MDGYSVQVYKRSILELQRISAVSLCLPLSAVWATVQRWTVTALHSVFKHFHTDDLINKWNKVTKASISHFRYNAFFCTLTFSPHAMVSLHSPTLLFSFYNFFKNFSYLQKPCFSMFYLEL